MSRGGKIDVIVAETEVETIMRTNEKDLASEVMTMMMIMMMMIRLQRNLNTVRLITWFGNRLQ